MFGGERYRRYRGALEYVTKGLAIAIVLYAIVYVLVVPRIGVVLYKTVYVASFVGLMSALVFLRIPATRNAPRDRLPWYDLLLIVANLAGAYYVAINFERFSVIEGRAWASPIDMVLFLATAITIFEAVRRTVGFSLIILALAFLLHANFAYLLPGLLGGPKYSLARISAYLYLMDGGMFGMIAYIAATIIVVFMTFGSFLQQTGAGKFFTDSSLAVVGHMRGGPAKVAVIASAFFGTISGSPMANVGTTGVVTIPLMKSLGYKASFAGAVEAVASTGGAIMPPVMGAVAFIMADMTGAGYAAVAIAAIVPAVLYFLALFFQVDFEAAKGGLTGLPRAELPSLSKTLKEGWQFMIPLLILALLMMVLQYEPLESALYALGAVIVVSFLRKETRLTPVKLAASMEGGAEGLLSVLPICALAGVMMGTLELTGLAINIATLLKDISGGNLLILVIMAGVACYMMGMGISVIISYIVLAIVVAPAMVQLGVPVLVAHMFIFYMGCSTFITPPNAGAVFLASAIARAGLWETGWRAMRLGIVTYLVPFVIVYNPALILEGPPLEIVLAVATSMIGVYALAAGIEGYLLTRTKWWQTVLLLAGGTLLFIPGWATDVIGAVIVGVIVLSQRARVRQTRRLPELSPTTVGDGPASERRP